MIKCIIRSRSDAALFGSGSVESESWEDASPCENEAIRFFEEKADDGPPGIDQFFAICEEHAKIFSGYEELTREEYEALLVVEG